MARPVCAALALIAGAQMAAAAAAQQQQQLKIEPWGKDSIRVRAAPASRGVHLHAPGALDAQPPVSTAITELLQPTDGSAPVVSGVLNCTVASDGRLEFFRTGEEGGEPVLAEASVRVFGDTTYSGVSNLTLSFSLSEGQKIWGLGQVESTALDLSGQCQPTAPDNGHIVIPLAHSSTGVSWFLNLPSYGTVCIDAHGKANRQFTWFSRGAFNMDLWVTASDEPATALPDAISSYVEATGKPTPFPAWTTGFWQSKNRYRSTSEVLGIAHEYQRLDIPLSLMIIDEGAWDLLGNEGWGGCSNGSITATGEACPCFENATAMTAELKSMGIEVMLSPYMQFAVEQSSNFPAGKAAGAFAVGVKGKPGAGEPACYGYSGYNQKNAQDYRCLNSTGGREFNAYCGDGCMWDVFADAAGEMMMKNLVKHFYKESGVSAVHTAEVASLRAVCLLHICWFLVESDTATPLRVEQVKWWWLDCDEPCDYTGRVSSGDTLLWGKGEWPDIAVGAAYPMMLNKAIFKRMHDVEKEEHVVTLARSAWAGSQRWGTAVWSGDTSSTWESYRLQISEGQQASLSGISYWSSDTGGYQGLDMTNKRGFDMDLLMRWFQFSAFCGIFRVHGYRAPEMDTGTCSSDTSYASGLGLSPTSAHNEVYTFTSADHIYNYSAAIIKVVKLRESMRGYVAKLFDACK